jgi:hypothetical protein
MSQAQLEKKVAAYLRPDSMAPVNFFDRSLVSDALRKR